MKSGLLLIVWLTLCVSVPVIAFENADMTIEQAENIIQNSGFEPMNPLLDGCYTILGGSIVINQNDLIALAKEVQQVADKFTFSSEDETDQDYWYHLDDNQIVAIFNKVMFQSIPER